MRRAYEVFTNSFSNLFDSEDLSLGLKGSLKVADFVTYGDALVELNSIWRWAVKSDSMFDKNLPEEKQYLFSDRVSCLNPPKTATSTHDSWVVTGKSEDDPNNLYEEDSAGLEEIVYRRYGLSVTFDAYNETARLWLRGFDQFGLPLTKDQMLEDVPESFVGKTITVEKHPFTGFFCLTVHPCNQREICSTNSEIFEFFQDKNVLVNYLKMWASVFPCVNILEGFQSQLL